MSIRRSLENEDQNTDAQFRERVLESFSHFRISQEH
jgi:hypothetical protein